MLDDMGNAGDMKLLMKGEHTKESLRTAISHAYSRMDSHLESGVNYLEIKTSLP